MPAIITPPETKTIALFRGIQNKNAATDPVQAPVIGNGIATKRSKAHSPYLAYFFSKFFVTCLNHQSKSFLKSLDLEANHSDKGLRNKIIKIAGIISPRIDNKKANQGAISKTPIAKGIEPRNSTIGNIANKIVASQSGNCVKKL